MKTLLIIGASFSSVRENIRAHGFEYIVLKDIHKAQNTAKTFKRRVLCDFSSKESVLAAVDSIQTPISGVIAIYENYILPGAWVAEHLGLPGLTPSAAEACTDKELMRELFAKAPAPISPDFMVVNNQAGLEQFAAKHGFPLILKPANLAKSLLVTKNHTLAELRQNYQATVSQIDAVYAKYAPHRTPKLLVEEFLEGSIHSVDAFIGSDGIPQVLEQVVDYQTGYDIGFDDNFHYSRLLPSKLSKAVIADIRAVGAMGCEALGMKNTAAHIEVILTKKGPRIVEIGARNGGYRERMHGLANGIDINGIALKVAMGKSFSVAAGRNDHCAVLELFPKHQGLFSHIAGQAELEKLSSLTYFARKVTPGATVGKAANGYKMCAIIMLHNSNAEEFAADLEFVNKNVHVVTT